MRIRPRSARQTTLIIAGGAALGVGTPLAWFLIGASANWANSERYAALIGGVAVSYLLLAAVIAAVVARHRIRQTRRETNLPWDRSVSEWRDVPGEFDHVLEEMLITGAAISAVLSLALLFAIGLSG